MFIIRVFFILFFSLSLVSCDGSSNSSDSSSENDGSSDSSSENDSSSDSSSENDDSSDSSSENDSSTSCISQPQILPDIDRPRITENRYRSREGDYTYISKQTLTLIEVNDQSYTMNDSNTLDSSSSLGGDISTANLTYRYELYNPIDDEIRITAWHTDGTITSSTQRDVINQTSYYDPYYRIAFKKACVGDVIIQRYTESDDPDLSGGIARYERREVVGVNETINTSAGDFKTVQWIVYFTDNPDIHHSSEIWQDVETDAIVKQITYDNDGAVTGEFELISLTY